MPRSLRRVDYLQGKHQGLPQPQDISYPIVPSGRECQIGAPDNALQDAWPLAARS
jgi:hypothetical protein